MDALEKFGQFTIANFRDKALQQHDMLLQGKLKEPAIKELQAKITALPEEQRALIRQIVVDTIDTAMHDFLFAIQDAHDRELGVEVLVDGKNIAEVSGMLHGEQLGKGGWIEKYSKYS
jgi:hypothetical protein